ncbi:integrase [Nitrobacteraceae bacterium AZCC 2161]
MVLALGTPKRHPESGIYWFRKRVPDRLRESVGRTEIKFSLRTPDPQVARLRNLDAMLKLERAWAGHDIALLGADGSPVAFFECKGLPVATPARIGTVEDGPTSDARAGLPIDPRLARLDAEIPAAAVRSTGHRSAGRKSNESNAVEGGSRSARPASMRGVFESYAAEAELSPATVKRWKPVIEAFVAHLGHDDAGRVTRADVVGWKDSLLAGGMSNITVRDVYLGAVRATLQYGADQSGLSDNPAAGVKVRVKKGLRERDKGFDQGEALTILAATRLPPSANISLEMAAARRWVPWICAYSGARVNEITPLTGRDIVMRDGVVLMRIRAETNKTRKYRMVPLHSHLLEQGLLDYVKSRGTRPLFYEPSRARGGSEENPHYKKVGERVGSWVRSLGIDARVAPNHGWRHRFASVARFVSMPEDVHHVIQGHAGANVADRYGDTWPQVAHREIEKLPRYAA